MICSLSRALSFAESSLVFIKSTYLDRFFSCQWLHAACVIDRNCPEPFDKLSRGLAPGKCNLQAYETASNGGCAGVPGIFTPSTHPSQDPFIAYANGELLTIEVFE